MLSLVRPLYEVGLDPKINISSNPIFKTLDQQAAGPYLVKGSLEVDPELQE